MKSELSSEYLREPFNGYGNYIEAKPFKHRGNSNIALYFEFNKDLIAICKQLGAKWSKSNSCWYLENTPANFRKVMDAFKGEAWLDIRALQEEKIKNTVQKKRNPNWHLSATAKKELTTYDKILKTHRYSKSSRLTYGNMVKRFLNYFCERNSRDLSHDDIINFIHDYVIGGEYSESYQRQMVSALKLFYLKVHQISDRLDKVPLLKKRRKLPTVISEGQAFDLIRACRNLKHKFCIALLYGCGLRIGDVLNMQVKDVDLDRMVIDVKDGKGRKDRTVPFPKSLVNHYKHYIAQYRPKKYLFEGQNGGAYSRESINKVIKRAASSVGIEKRISAHTLRHSFATHLMNKGVNQRFIQEILGHKSSKTTEIYTHVSNANLNLIENPLDEMVAKSRNGKRAN